ncbi:MAG TPA: hypothetical protein VLI54_03570 [Bacillota bacterium]|nr:hypothetical protein [Bacillota bacterium]
MPTVAASTLDTSIFIEQIKHTPSAFLSRLYQNSPGSRNTLYYCLIEFRLGLLHSWVEYFKSVEALGDVHMAISVASETFRIRELKNHALLQATLSYLNDSIHPHDIDLYLAQVESAIFEIQEMTQRIIRRVEGNFEGHPVLAATLNSREDYGEFLRICKEDYVVSLQGFLKQREGEIGGLLQYLRAQSFKGRDGPRAQAVCLLLEAALAQPDKCDMKSKNRRYGDIVIALDSPKQNIILTKDALFRLLSDGLGKSSKVISF